MSATPRRARVLRLDARGCLVSLEDGEATGGDGARTVWCAVRGRIHLRDRTGQTSPVAVGDLVHVTVGDGERGAVVKILPRTSTLSRPAAGRGTVEHVMAANVDRVLVVTSLADPPFNPGLVDRVLAVVEFSHLEALIAVNKMDLGEEPPAQIATYRALGYEVLLTSATERRGLDGLRAALAGHHTVVCGHSGVGKTSLLNALQPGLGLEEGEVNPVSGRGTHTTAAAVWIPYAEGGAVVDTAGVRVFGLFGIPRRDVPWLFRDLAKVGPECRYPDCLHLQEPDCAVRPAVERGEIAPFRYESYLRILESLEGKGP